jgi:hypothetical protein
VPNRAVGHSDVRAVADFLGGEVECALIEADLLALRLVHRATLRNFSSRRLCRRRRASPCQRR